MKLLKFVGIFVTAVNVSPMLKLIHILECILDLAEFLQMHSSHVQDYINVKYIHKNSASSERLNSYDSS